MKKMFILTFLVLLASCDFETDVDSSSEKVSDNALVFAVMGRYRDNEDPFGRGVQMVADKVNALGGIGGRPIELVFRKSDCSATVAAFEAERLLELYPDIIGVTGPECSGAGGAVNQIMGTQNIPIVAYTTSSPSLSIADTYFRLQASDLAIIDGFVLTMMKESDLDDDGKLSLAIIYGDDLFNAGIGKGIVDGFIAAGGEVLSEVSYPDGTLVDFSDYLMELLSPSGVTIRPDIVAIMGFEKEIANITLQMSDSFPSVEAAGLPVYMSGLDDVVLTDGAPAIIENAVTLTPDGAFSKIVFPYLEDFLTHYNQLWGTQVTNEDAAQGYDAMMLQVLALLQAQESNQIDVNSANTNGIRQAILDNIIDVSRGVNDFEKQGDAANTAYLTPFNLEEATQAIRDGLDLNYNGASGYIDFDHLGDINYGAFYLQVTVKTNDGFTVENLNLSCFGPEACE